MELMVVKMEDVYPDEANPRQSFDGIEELAASFDLNAERPGEPFTPPLLVRDGGIFRIVDGERRYRALKLRKAKEFQANVCSDMDEADSMAAMLATDDKAPLTELERSRGAQRMLLLGVDPVKVEKAARFKGADKLAAVMAKADDAAEDLTLDRALAAAEFLDDDEAFEELMTCPETEWRWQAERLRGARRRAARRAAFLEVCEAHGVKVLEKIHYGEYTRYGMFSSAEELDAALDDIDPALGDPLAWIDLNPGCDIYFTKAAGVGGPAEDSEQEKASFAARAAIDAADGQIRAFFWSKASAKRGKRAENLRALAFDKFKYCFLDDYGACDGLDEFPDLVAADPSLMDLCLGYVKLTSNLGQWTIQRMAKGEAGSEREVLELRDLYQAAEADGFGFDEVTQPAKEFVEAYLDRASGDGE